MLTGKVELSLSDCGYKNKTAANHFGAVSGSTFTINYVLYNYVDSIVIS